MPTEGEENIIEKPWIIAIVLLTLLFGEILCIPRISCKIVSMELRSKYKNSNIKKLVLIKIYTVQFTTIALESICLSEITIQFSIYPVL